MVPDQSRSLALLLRTAVRSQLAAALLCASVAGTVSSSGATGQLWSVGQNHDGQLGDGTTTSRNLPSQVLGGVSAVAAGGSATEGSHSLFLKADASLWAAG